MVGLVKCEGRVAGVDGGGVEVGTGAEDGEGAGAEVKVEEAADGVGATKYAGGW